MLRFKKEISFVYFLSAYTHSRIHLQVTKLYGKYSQIERENWDHIFRIERSSSPFKRERPEIDGCTGHKIIKTPLFITIPHLI